MESTTYAYLNDNYTDEFFTPAAPCSPEGDNYLGAWLSILYYFMFVFSLFGNGLVLLIIHRFEKLTTVTNILLLNLVISSMIFTSSLPFWGVYMELSDWIFGKVMCKIVGSVYYLGFYSSVLFLTLLTFDRHLAVVYSLRTSQMRTRTYAVTSCFVVWLVSGLACIKPMIVHTTFRYISNKTYCQEYPGDIIYIDMALLKISGFYLQLFLFLLFPLAVIVYCYIRISITVLSSKIITKFKTVRLIFTIVLLFFICWTPFNIVILMYYNEDQNCEQMKRKGYAFQVTRNIAFIYFCISPIIYTFVGKKFRSYFRRLLVRHYPGLKKRACFRQCNRTNSSTKSTSKC